MIDNRELSAVDPVIADLLNKELERKETCLELIPSENCVSEAVLEVTGSIFTDKYCEGYPGRRYYGGCVYYDEVERLAISRACELFGMEAANVQPHSGANANMAVFLSVVEPGDTVLGPKLDHGGHLSHGSKVNFSGMYYNCVGYGVHPETGLYEEEEIDALAQEHRPKMIICGASAYSRQIDFPMFRRVADRVGATLLADVSHYSGLIVGGAYQSPVGHAHIVTTTTHKTLRGPRGGMILSDKERIKRINKMVFPGTQGGPLMHQIAAKAVAFGEALQPSFKDYAHKVVENAKVLAGCLMERGFEILSGGTDSHLMVLDFRGSELTGKLVEEVLSRVGITVNKNTVPNDPRPAAVTSGVRLGTPAITSRGFESGDMRTVARWISEAVESREDENKLAAIREEVRNLCRTYPLYPQRSR